MEQCMNSVDFVCCESRHATAINGIEEVFKILAYEGAEKRLLLEFLLSVEENSNACT